MFTFSRSGKEAKRGVVGRHSTRTPREVRKVGNRSALIKTEYNIPRFPLPTQLYVGYSLLLKSGCSRLSRELLVRIEKRHFNRNPECHNS